MSNPTKFQCAMASSVPAYALFECVLLLIITLAGCSSLSQEHSAVLMPTLRQGQFESFPLWGTMADFTISPDGQSFEEVRDAIRILRQSGDERKFIVDVKPGKYRIKSIVFDRRDYNTSYSTRGNGEAILSSSLGLPTKAFVRPSEIVLTRLSLEARENVRALDLTTLGMTASDWGKLYSFGGFTTAAMYDDGVGPLPCELFYNGRRQTIARYPNGSQWLNIGEIIDNGESRETYQGGTVRNLDFDQRRNPRGGTFEMDKATTTRTASWATYDDVWVFGFFKWDWADMSTPVKTIDPVAGTLTTEYASIYGFEQGRTYYFYNVLEELDEPGEWYLDRKNGLLYFWPPEGDFNTASIELLLNADTLITGEGVYNLIFRGLTLQGTLGDGMILKGDNIIVDHCVVRNLAGSAITLTGSNNTVSNNEVYHVGKQGITIRGGDQTTLTSGNNRALNNLVHDFAEVVMTYQGGVNIYGTGNMAAHNEIYNSPHTAIFFSGNNHVIKFNNIHDVCLATDDAGAIYCGRSFYNAQGTVIRNNALVNIGSKGRYPNGIYLDDGLSGIVVKNNLLVNIPGAGIAISGRDLEIHDNVIVNAGTPISYDQRTRDGALATNPNFLFYAHTGYGGDMWRELEASPWQTELWRAAFPELAALSVNFDDIEAPTFAANPAGSSVTGNMLVGSNIPRYAESVLRFSTIGPNDSYDSLQQSQIATHPAIKNIQLGRIGRVQDFGIDD